MTPFTSEWVSTITADLRDGYGIEDIAVRHNFNADDVRTMVRHMQSRGELRAIYQQKVASE